ncbi:M20 family metallopeptidase [Caldimonas aquatica]|uniref:M20 family metallopeptidase n=1 Tax=Caldimonas aquatica TaxID=376175 RepID=A0ABY6MT69_9BURK|nr:M20 family metallopeptidase [Schlegelella aquatica]UZD55188.1 M20 family metallopeptidase [Schlegelella aquatica]
MNAPERLPLPEPGALQDRIDEVWDREIIPALQDYIRVPAKSPGFDSRWAEHGHLEAVVRQAAQWVESQQVEGLQLEIVRLTDAQGRPRTPLLWFEVPATRAGSTETVVMYGHLDKQPEFNGWRSDLGPWTPKLEDGRLYGRGGADDGYAVYASITALKSLQRAGVSHPRVVGLIETCEESGSYDLPHYLEALRPRLGDVGLVVCLDSGAGNYDQLWLTTSLRGLAVGTLKVEVLTEGVHSGDASGLVPSSFRILRQLLDRLEDARNGHLLPAGFHCEIPADRIEQAREAARILGDEVWKRYPWACGAEGGFTLPTTTDPTEALLRRTWRPALSITGADGFPALENAGNVLRPYTAFKLSLRLPPLVDGVQAMHELKRLLEVDPPYRARVTFEPDHAATGWNAPALASWLHQALDQASRTFYGAPVGFIGQGGTIPLMNMLQAGFPRAQMMVCGVLGPKSNAHGPNEFLHVPYGKKLTASVAAVLAAMPS